MSDETLPPAPAPWVFLPLLGFKGERLVQERRRFLSLLVERYLLCRICHGTGGVRGACIHPRLGLFLSQPCRRCTGTGKDPDPLNPMPAVICWLCGAGPEWHVTHRFDPNKKHCQSCGDTVRTPYRALFHVYEVEEDTVWGTIAGFSPVQAIPISINRFGDTRKHVEPDALFHCRAIIGAPSPYLVRACDFEFGQGPDKTKKYETVYRLDDDTGDFRFYVGESYACVFEHVETYPNHPTRTDEVGILDLLQRRTFWWPEKNGVFTAPNPERMPWECYGSEDEDIAAKVANPNLRPFYISFPSIDTYHAISKVRVLR